MSTPLWRQLSRLLVFSLLLSFAVFTFAQSTTPDDDTTDVLSHPTDPDVRATGAEKDNPTDRLEWQRKAWGVPNAEFRQRAMREGEEYSRRKKQRGPTWVSIGPTGADYEQNGSFTGLVRDAGRARTVLPHPTNANIVYFLMSGGGLWKTTNWMSNNTRWSVLTDDLPTTGGGSVAFGRTPNVLYLGLGDPYDQIMVGGSMVKSTDGGESWSAMIELGTAVSVRDVKVDTSAFKDIVLVATDNGLFRSADAGATYSAIAEFAGQSVWSIERTSAGWLASGQPCPAVAVGLLCGQATTLQISTDKGATWAPITNAGNVFNAAGRTTLGVGVPGDAVVYAYANNVTDGSVKDIYRSIDGGQTWIANNVMATPAPITNPVAGMTTMNICHGQCWYNQMILVDPRDSTRNTVWVGGDLASARTTDGGVSWTVKTWWLYSQFTNNPKLPYAHADHHDAAFKLTGTPTLILGNDGGLNISTDDGLTFSSDKNNGLATHLFYTVAGNPKFPNLVIGGTQDDGTRLRIGNGTIYNQVIGGDGMGAAYSQANTNTVIGSSQGSGMRTNQSNNPPTTFQNWVAATSGLADVGFGFFTAVLPAPANLDETGKVFFHFSNSRVWRTNNGGLTWTLIGAVPLGIAGQPVSPGLPLNRRFRSSPYNIGVSPTDLNRVAVGAAGGFLDITTNANAAFLAGGAANVNWVDLNLITLVPGYQGFVTNVTWQDNKTLWITAVAQAPGAVRVIKATIANESDSWTTASFAVKQNGLPDLPVTRILFDPADDTKQTIYAATHVGIFRTTNGGDSWETFGNGLPNVRVNDIYMPPDGGFIRIATYGRGIWELPQFEFVGAKLSDSSSSCDRDGVLDNGETGRLTVTLLNRGRREVDRIRATVTSSNPNITFPNGNTINFGEAEGRETVGGSIRVKLSGAAGIESTDLNLAITALDGLHSTFNVVSSHRLNYDDKLAVSATESAESSRVTWAAAGNPTSVPNVDKWQRRQLAPTQHVWWGPDNNGQKFSDDGVDTPDEQSLVSPTLKVGSGPLAISFQHRHALELDSTNATRGFDGGVIEISSDNGATWVDVGDPLYNGTIAPGADGSLAVGRRALVRRNVGWPAFVPATLDLGTAFANKDVKLRFRIAADSTTGAPGWEIDNINISGITNTPFSDLVAEAGSCRNRGHDDDDD